MLLCFSAEIASLPEEQHDGKHLFGWWRENHAQLNGLLQVVMGNVEAVVVDIHAEEKVLMHRAPLQ